MKKVILFVLFISVALLGIEKKKLKTTIRSAAEQVITKRGFTILNAEIQEEALAEQNNAVESDCIDDACLMDTGKMLSAQRLFIIRISKLAKDQYLFKIIHTNLETNEMIASQSEIYIGKLKDYNKLFYFGKKFFNTIFHDKKIFAQNSGKEKIPVMIETIVETGSQNEKKDGKKFILSIKTNPEGVNIFNGNEIIGISPVTLQMPAGNYNLIFQKDGYDRMEQKVELFKNEEIEIKQLYTEGGPYPINIKTKIISKLYYKGRFKGNTSKVIDFKTGKHKIELENDVAGRKAFIIDVIGAEEKSFSMNYGFKWAKFSVNTEFWYMSFPNQITSNIFLSGFDISLFIWNWNYFDIDIIGGGFSAGLDGMMSWKIHILGLNIKPIKNFNLNISIGPLLGDYIRIYDNKDNLWIALAGVKLLYNYKVNRLFSVKLYSSFYYGHSNSEKSMNTQNIEVSSDSGFIINFGLNLSVSF